MAIKPIFLDKASQNLSEAQGHIGRSIEQLKECKKCPEIESFINRLTTLQLEVAQVMREVDDQSAKAWTETLNP